MIRSSAPACAAQAPTRNCCAPASSWQNASWDSPGRMNAMSSIPTRSSRRGPKRRSSVWDLTDDQLKFPRARVERDVRHDGHVERHVAQTLLRQYFRKPLAHSRRSGAALPRIERAVDTNGEAERGRPGDLHLKARDAFHENLIDGVRTEKVVLAGCIEECGQSLGASDQSVNDDARRAGRADGAQDVR